MSQVTVFNCDGPDCLRSDDESLDDGSLRTAGWVTVQVWDEEDEIEREAHLCSFECLSKWALELVE